MKSYTHYLTFNTRQRRERARMTDEVQQAVSRRRASGGWGWGLSAYIVL